MSPLLHDYHVRVLLPCYRETPEMVRDGTCQAPPVMHPCPAYVQVGSETAVAAALSAKPPLTCGPLLQIRTTAQAVLAAHLPPGCRRTVYVCDDGKDPVKRVSDSRCAATSLCLSAHEHRLSGSQHTLVVSSTAGFLIFTSDMHIRGACCLQAWVSELGRIDLQYIADRIRTPGEVNGKSANLNNALNHIFPPGTAIGFNEVLQRSSSI